MIVVKVDNSVRDQAFSHCLPGLDTLNQTYFHLFMSVLVCVFVNCGMLGLQGSKQRQTI